MLAKLKVCISNGYQVKSSLEPGGKGGRPTSTSHIQWNLAIVNFRIVKNLAIVKNSGDTN